MAQVVLKHVTKKFEEKSIESVVAVDDFNLEIEEGECFSFLGPSGCGKTTTLRMIAGFEDLTEGEIHLCGRPVSVKSKNLYVPPEERGLGMVFQAFAVWPHMNIFENVALPLKVQKVARNEIKERVAAALSYTNLDGLESLYPGNLSGGQQQRIALARAIVTNPKVMLLDEPLSNLDPKLRESMRFEIKELQKKFNFTIIFVTHDQSEAMALSDRMMVMDMGKIVQIDTPRNLYNKPVNRFVHSFLGKSTFVKVEIKDGKAYPDGDYSQAIPCRLPDDASNGEKRFMAARPNAINLNKSVGYKTKIEKRVFLTDCTEYYVKVGGQMLLVQTPHRVVFRQGEECRVDLVGVMWYKDDDKNSEEERNRRQLV
ncbi:ABC transporter ATP-binding protein [Treponema socranskii]|uniref:ABC transporter ATP-binding protein n=1 Tax=Treponema socranskii TaxID=53419 RepID=UPI0028EA315A|nr:ABC transporter ATP-binding protein [Treponema socranskii]